MTTSPHPDMPDLQKAFDFTNEDLQASYEGWITQRQKDKAIGHANDYLWFLGLGWGMFIIVIVATLFYELELGLVISCLAFAIPITLILLVERYKITYGVNQGKLKVIEGYSVLSYRRVTSAGRPPSHASARCYLQIYGNHAIRFDITLTQYEALRDQYSYRVFYLPVGKVILTIEPTISCGENRMVLSPHPDMPDLQKAFDFTDEDLKANRDGVVTASQRRNAVKRGNDNLWIVLVLWFSLGGCFLIILLDSPYEGMSTVGFIYLFSLIGLTFWYFNERRRIITSKVQVAEAVIKLEKVVKKGGRFQRVEYYLIIDSLRFNLWPAAQVGALRDAHSYRIYYLSDNYILSIEPLF